MCEQVEVSEVPQISYQESVDAVEIILEQIRATDVLKISERERILQRSRLEKLGVYIRMWTWTSTRTTMERLRREGQGGERAFRGHRNVVRGP